jgi:hypothetical protein
MMAPTLREALETGETVVRAHLAAGNKRDAAALLASLGYTALFQDDPATARALSERALAIAEAGDALPKGLAVGNASLAALFQDDVAGARAGFVAELRIAAQLRNNDLLGEALEGLAALAALEGRDERAAELKGCAERIPSAGTDPIIWQRIDAKCFRPAQDRLGRVAWEAAHERLDPRRAIEDILSGTHAA